MGRRERLFEEAVQDPGVAQAEEAAASLKAAEEAARLEAVSELRDSLGWRVLKDELARQQAGAMGVVLGHTRSLDEIRFAQGCVQTLGRVVEWVENYGKTGQGSPKEAGQ